MISIEKKPLHKQLDAFLGITIRFEYCRCFFFFFFVTLRRFVVRWRSPHRNSTQDLHQRAPYGSILKKKYKRKKKKKIFVVRQGGKEGEVKQKEKRNSKKKKKKCNKEKNTTHSSNKTKTEMRLFPLPFLLTRWTRDDKLVRFRMLELRSSLLLVLLIVRLLIPRRILIALSN